MCIMTWTRALAAERNLVRKRFHGRRIKSSIMSASSWSVHKRSGAKVKPPASMLLACSLLPGRPLVSMQATGFPYSAPHSCIGVGVSPLPCWPPLPFMHSQPPLSDCALSAAGRQVVAGLARPLRPLANQTISQTCSGLSGSASLEATAFAWAKAEVFCIHSF